jgi:hypothetical protein
MTTAREREQAEAPQEGGPMSDWPTAEFIASGAVAAMLRHALSVQHFDGERLWIASAELTVEGLGEVALTCDGVKVAYAQRVLSAPPTALAAAAQQARIAELERLIRAAQWGDPVVDDDCPWCRNSFEHADDCPILSIVKYRTSAG